MTALLAVGCSSSPNPSASLDEPALATCTNEVVPYAVHYPAEWYVVPADEDEGIESCTYFARERFEFTPNNVPLRTGASAIVNAAATCMGDEIEPLFRRELEVDGFPAREEEFERPVIYQFVIQVREGETCGDQGIVVIRTEGHAPGDYAENKQMVRLLVQGLDIRPPDE